jgi:hypothetical protein
MLFNTRAVLAAVLALILPFVVVAGASPASEVMTADIGPRVSRAPGTVRVLARIPRNSENRRLTVALEGDQYIACSEFPLDGLSSPIAHLRTYDGLPAGIYSITIELWRLAPRPQLQLTRQIEVLGERSDEFPLPRQTGRQGTGPGNTGRGNNGRATNDRGDRGRNVPDRNTSNSEFGRDASDTPMASDDRLSWCGQKVT